MSTPGVSLFQGAESLHINTSIPPEDEEEELADQRRRNEELGNLLENAFDDLEVDDDTIDCTHNSPIDHDDSINKNYQHHVRGRGHGQSLMLDNNDPMYLSLPTPPRAITDNQHQQHGIAFEAEIHQLKMLLESKTRELENIKKIANDEFAKRDEIQKRLAITEAELDRALSSKKNTHELLVESKEKCSNLENTISKIRNEKKLLESENSTLLGKLETSQALLSDLQQKYNMVERDLGKHSERNTEQLIKQLEEHHRAEVEILQQQLEQMADKLERKSSELENMNSRYHALQNTHEMMLLDKATTINELGSALNDAQRKCEELLAKRDYSQENIRLQKLVSSLQEQIAGMEKTIHTLSERLEFTTAELDVMDSLLHQNNMEDTPCRLSRTHGGVVGSTPLTTVDRVGHLKNELCRALTNLKSKRDEIRKLQNSLDEKNTKVRRFQEEENKALVEITTLREEKIRLESRLRILEAELSESHSRSVEHSANTSKMERLTVEMEQLKQKNNFMEQQIHELERERNRYELDHNRLDAQLKQLHLTHDELKQEHDNLKHSLGRMHRENDELRNRTTYDDARLELEKHKFLLKDAQAECDRLKDLYVEICNAKEMLSYEVEKFRSMDSVKELHEEREKVANLQRALHLAGVKADELAKLLEAEKLNHERDVNAIREKLEKEKANEFKASQNKSNNCSKCMDYMADITKFEIQLLKLGNLSSVHNEEMENLTRELAKSKDLIAELTEKLKLSEHQEQLIKELRIKAHQFEDYINQQRRSSERSPPFKENVSSSSSSDKGVGTSPELEKEEIKKVETRIREEMAKAHAIYLKRYQMAATEAEKQLLALQHEYSKLSVEYKRREKEVEVLKELILAEREEMGRILKKKDTDHKELTEQQNALIRKCRDELHEKNDKLEELAKELEERQSQIEAERKSMKAVMEQWEQQRKGADAIEDDWKEKLAVFRRIQESAIESLKSKYNSAKRTAANYKRYAEDKEAHMLKEYERLKFEYDASLVKIEQRMKEELDKKNREWHNRIVKNGEVKGFISNKENETDNGIK